MGTKLCIIESERIPWYKLPEFGGKEVIPIYDDLLPEHFNKNLKDLPSVLNFLELTKRSIMEQTQLMLPGFEV